MRARPKRAPRRVLGVDFSGANDAGRKIWVAECKRGRGNRLTLIDLRPACDLPESGVTPHVAIAALARHIAKEPDTIAGCDFPFTLPRTVTNIGKLNLYICAEVSYCLLGHFHEMVFKFEVGQIQNSR